MSNQLNVKNRSKKPLAFDYSDTLQAIVVNVADEENLFPFYLKVKAGCYKIIKNKTGTLQMTK